MERIEWKHMLNTLHRSELIASSFIIHLSQFWLCSKDYINITSPINILTFHFHSNFNNNLILTHIINISICSSILSFCLVYICMIKEESWEDWTLDVPKPRMSKKNLFKKNNPNFFFFKALNLTKMFNEPNSVFSLSNLMIMVCHLKKILCHIYFPPTSV